MGLVATWGLLGLSSSVWLTSLLLFVLGFGLADMFLQAVHVSNQNVVYPLRPDARARLNSVYMTTYFAGGALGSAVGSAAWGAGGWPSSAPSARVSGSWSCSSGSSTCAWNGRTGAQRCRRRYR